MTQSPPQPIRIIIADDHPVVRRGLALVLRQEPEFEIVGEAGDGAAAHSLIFDLVPNVVLLDWKMPKMDGFEAARLIKRDMASVKTLILSGAPFEVGLFDKLGNVDGFVHKDITPRNLAHAIRTVADGQRYLGPHVGQAILHHSSKLKGERSRPRLSRRELQVLNLMATPATYKQMAVQLVISETTILTYVKRILQKLSQPNRTQAVLAALRQNLIELR